MSTNLPNSLNRLKFLIVEHSFIAFSQKSRIKKYIRGICKWFGGNFVEMKPCENDVSTQLAREAFAYLSEVSKRERDQANDNCQYFVDVAKSMIEMPERQDEATFGLPANPFISQNTYQGFQVYPNPASDRINLVNMEGENLVQLVDAMGRVLYEQKIQQSTMTISTEKMETGMYFLMVKPILETSTATEWKKVSINKQ